jgi:hypothetical protein
MELAGAVLEAEYDDHNCNHVSLIAFTPGATDVTIRCRGVVDTADNAGIVGKHSGHLPLWHFAEPTELTRAGPRVRALLAALGGQTQGQSQGKVRVRVRARVRAMTGWRCCTIYPRWWPNGSLTLRGTPTRRRRPKPC